MCHLDSSCHKRAFDCLRDSFRKNGLTVEGKVPVEFPSSRSRSWFECTTGLEPITWTVAGCHSAGYSELQAASIMQARNKSFSQHSSLWIQTLPFSLRAQTQTKQVFGKHVQASSRYWNISIIKLARIYIYETYRTILFVTLWRQIGWLDGMVVILFVSQPLLGLDQETVEPERIVIPIH